MWNGRLRRNDHPQRRHAALPIGVPKLLISTVAAGDVSAYVGSADVTMMHSVVDVAGVNRISREIYTNAAAAIAGMVQAIRPESAAEKAAGGGFDVRQHDGMHRSGARIAGRRRLGSAGLPRHRNRRQDDAAASVRGASGRPVRPDDHRACG